MMEWDLIEDFEVDQRVLIEKSRVAWILKAKNRGKESLNRTSRILIQSGVD
jgi:hypothetical protein